MGNTLSTKTPSAIDALICGTGPVSGVKAPIWSTDEDTVVCAWRFSQGPVSKDLPKGLPGHVHVELVVSEENPDPKHCYIVITNDPSTDILTPFISRNTGVLTPRGLSGHLPMLGVLKSSSRSPRHGVFVWNGRDSHALVRATALTRGLQLERGLDIDVDSADVRQMFDVKPKIGISLNLTDVETRAKDEEAERKRAKLAHFDKECSHILDGLFLGSETVARSRESLATHNVTHVLNCAGLTLANFHETDSSLAYLTLYLADSPTVDIHSHFYDVLQFIDAAIEGGGNVFVHCHQGVSRSSSMVILYVMWKKNWGYDEAYQYVRNRRGVCNPNAGFVAQLLNWRKYTTTPLTDEVRMYRIAPHRCTPDAETYRGPDPRDTHLVAIPILKQSAQFGAEGLDPRTVVIVQAQRYLFVWCGVNAPETYVSMATDVVVGRLKEYENVDVPVVVINQGSEPEHFWALWDGYKSAGSEVKGWDIDYTPLPRVKKDQQVSGDDPPLRTRESSAETEEPKDTPPAEIPHMYRYPDWEEYETYDSDDLDAEALFAILFSGKATMWIGGDFGEEPPEDEEVVAMAKIVWEKFGNGAKLTNVEVVRDGDEPDEFWDTLFLNG